MTALVVLETVVLAVLVVLVSGLLRSHATILRRLHELGVDTAERPRPRPDQPAPTASRPAWSLWPRAPFSPSGVCARLRMATRTISPD